MKLKTSFLDLVKKHYKNDPNFDLIDHLKMIHHMELPDVDIRDFLPESKLIFIMEEH